MGFRFRKSINLGCGFRINMSKSGIGYSVGGKGFRITKTAKGNVRTTASIPGTGISYVEETSGKKDKVTIPDDNFASDVIDNNHLPKEYLVNANAKSMVSVGLEGIIESAERILKYNKYATRVAMLCFVLMFFQPVLIPVFILILIGKFFVIRKGFVDLTYIIEPDILENINERMEPILKIIESKKVWRITETSQVIDKKYTGGANNTIKREMCFVNKTAPFPFKSNVTAPTFTTANESLVFLPDKLFIIQGSDIGVLDYKDLVTRAGTTRFIEDETVPEDAVVTGSTWQYINKTGGPDKRFKNNKMLPICKYGELVLKSGYGLNTRIMFSKIFE